MLDQYRRNIEYIRISITDRCNLRCMYCMPEGGGLLKLYLVKDGGAVPLDTQKDGQYLCFNADGTQFTFYAERTPLWHVVAPIAGCVVLVLGVVIFWKRERIKNFVKDKRKKEE